LLNEPLSKDTSHKPEKKPIKPVLPYDSLHNGEIHLTRRNLFEGDNLEGEVKLYLEEEDFTDPELNQMKNELIFTLLCDSAAAFQALRHFPESAKCIEEASSIRSNDHHLLLLKGLNSYLDQSSHTSEKLQEALMITDHAIQLLSIDLLEAKGKTGSNYQFAETQTVFEFAQTLASDIQSSHQVVLQKNKAILLPVLIESIKELKSLQRPKKEDKEREALLQSKFALNHSKSSAPNSESKPKLNIDRIFVMTKMYVNQNET